MYGIFLEIGTWEIIGFLCYHCNLNVFVNTQFT